VLQQEQSLLFQPEVETLLEKNIAREKTLGNQQAVEFLEMHLDLLRACKTEGIEAAFAKLEGAQGNTAPFDRELVPRTVAALLGSPQEKMAHAEYLHRQAAQSQDEGLKALIKTIQTALFGENLDELGDELEDVYRETWEMIVLGVAQSS
jgi:alkylhydroperoxidase family enzyme